MVKYEEKLKLKVDDEMENLVFENLNKYKDYKQLIPNCLYKCQCLIDRNF